ncbi:MAG: hypothetical protein J7K66_01285 [Anaerolineaceae bacterium]|nr:hypothetical protein [Anaerolineaceae bacterium]
MENRRGMVGGLILILLGGFLLAVQLMPDIFGYISWPFLIIGIGGAFLLAALFTRNGGLAIPGCVIGGIGAILYYQVTTNNWASWSYIWTLIPGFVGVGTLIAGFLSRGRPHFDRGGLVLIAISAMGFLIFGGMFGIALDVDMLWPILLIGIGFITLVSAIFHRR